MARATSARDGASCGCSGIRGGRAVEPRACASFFSGLLPVARRAGLAFSRCRARASGGGPRPSGLSGAAIFPPFLPAALLLNVPAVVIAQIPGPTEWTRGAENRARRSPWSLGAAGLALAFRVVPLLAGAAPIVVPRLRLPRHRGRSGRSAPPSRRALDLTPPTCSVSAGVQPGPSCRFKILRRYRLLRPCLPSPRSLLAGALMETGGISERIRRPLADGDRRPRGAAALPMVVVVAERSLFSGISGSTAADVSRESARCSSPSMPKRPAYSGP